MNTPIQNVNLGRPCRVKHDRLRRESYEDAQELLPGQGKHLLDAWTEFFNGELDHELRDLVSDESLAATELAKMVCWPKRFYGSGCKLHFVATCEAMVERRASRMAEEL